MIIKESFQFTASNTDILSAPSRLAAIPQDGVLSLEIAATDCDGTNYGTVTLQLPDGEIPFEDLIVPYNGRSTGDAVLDNNMELLIEVPVQKGGHVLFSYTENGTVALTLCYATLTF